MEREPLDVFTQHQAGCHEQLGEVERVDALLFVFLELEAGVLQQVDGVLRVHVFSVRSKDGRRSGAAVIKLNHHMISNSRQDDKLRELIFCLGHPLNNSVCSL